MGYRSDVGLCLSKHGVHKLEEKIKSIKNNNELFEEVKVLFEFVNKMQEHAETGSRLYYWEKIKWYDNYNDIGFIEDLMLELDESDYHFTRIGEADDDIENRGSFGTILLKCMSNEN